MAAIGKFEQQPILAIAVSGGRDSMALALLANAWVAAKGGRTIALTVDHGLRSAAADEAAWVAEELSPLGIEHEILAWQGPKPQSGIQAAARDARYRLMAGWCEAHGVLHLLMAHHQGDQLETHLMRKERGSTAHGLAAMGSVRLLPNLRHLRPLLGIERRSLQLMLKDCHLGWLDDPSNDDMRFKRTQIRKQIADLTAKSQAALQTEIDEYGRHRADRAAMVANALAEACSMYELGYAEIDHKALMRHAGDVAERALVRLILTIGGQPFSPRLASLRNLMSRLKASGFQGATLGGVAFRPTGSRIQLVREPRNLPVEAAAVSNTDMIWDGRFRLAIGEIREKGLTIAPLGQSGAIEFRNRWPSGIPHAAAVGLPGLWRGNELLAAPGQDFTNSSKVAMTMTFSPQHSLDAA